ncbi:hypothetical protein [Cyclobacterium marinum]|nr:hypothetical protein [Cyclobacterium marinum]MBI0401283.1 hypothetical protein [Cyclobacterium marinum]
MIFNLFPGVAIDNLSRIYEKSCNRKKISQFGDFLAWHRYGENGKQQPSG